MKTVKIGIIGCGMIAKKLHAPDFDTCPQAELVAFCDIKKKRAVDLAAQYAPEAKIYSDYKALLKDKNVDAVTVCLPNYLHGPVTIAAAKAGKHIFVEKPMATSLAEARKMIAAARKAGVRLMVNQSQRLFGAHVKAKEVLDSGMMGKILHVTAMFGHGGPETWSPTGKWFFKKKEARFGAMADLGVHKADLIRYLTGKEVAEIGAFYACNEKKRTDVEDNFTACLKFTDGTLGTLAASWTVKGVETNYMYLHCEKGTLRINVFKDRPLVANLAEPRGEMSFDVPEAPTNYAGSWGIDAGGAFARAVLGQEPPFCTGEEGMKSLAIILAAEQAADTGRTVKVKY